MKDPGVAPDWVGTREAARILGVHENTIRNWCDQGLLPTTNLPFSGYRRFKRSDVEALRKEMDHG